MPKSAKMKFMMLANLISIPQWDFNGTGTHFEFLTFFQVPHEIFVVKLLGCTAPTTILHTKTQKLSSKAEK